jgi:hypothetical protein
VDHGQPDHLPERLELEGHLGPRLAGRRREHVLVHLRRDWSGAPAAFYKDANPRNFLLTQAGIVAVDVDDLSTRRSDATLRSMLTPRQLRRLGR